MLQFEDVTKSFKDGNKTIEAVKSTNFNIDEGDIVALVGPSGSGKSTFLTMAGALQTPTTGRILINQQDITTMRQKQLAKVRMSDIGFILQATNLVPFLTVKQQFTLLKKKKNNVMSDEDYHQLMTQLGLAELGNKLPSELSGGQRQRVAIAKALYTNPSIILADEPTASLDTENAIEVVKILRDQAKKRNKACIIVTHDERLKEYCDKSYHMQDGQLQLEQ
ncbi:ABC transporter ATP-binding protein [Staphylococcus simiae]|uniref:ABC transporter ATP-binding protein n=1 Tax=Staphylococcus simiae TaxID=308354 RepID=UPI001A97181C|nr:ABC transporter ATP-binding protein [Staphylococcus simiae]MBO1199973.1 ABC transporter ATP-binding protein [Staphylococcus simiae]MBO1202241.1 ABC transporter ATP-binding protein [Staphylococcus simiae]MBO1204502.1 ABC transporter ATP-binding protein [Staphylococcus simiae]MBO1212079.1 ABC transporter ATP-binding protein [Staphylococcus simiae]MBO1230678.1 ABC transporter ATP-binding protein [Staphylococcus simiae]